MVRSKLIAAAACLLLAVVFAVPTVHAGKGGGGGGGGGKPGGGGPITNPALVYVGSGLHLIAADGQSSQQLTDGANDDQMPKWRPGYSTVGFLRLTITDGGIHCRDLYEIGADGQGLTLLHDFCSTKDTEFNPSPRAEDNWDWSPDGTKVAFISNSGTYSPSLYVLDLAATPHTVTDLTPGDGPEFADDIESPSWSPDGTQIAFQGYVGWTSGPFPGEDIHVIHVATGIITKLTSDARPEKSPAWSSDGTRIAYLIDTGYPGPGHELMVMNADGANSNSLGVFAQRNEDQPTWSPDDQFISYVSTVTQRNKSNREVMKVDVTSGAPTNLTNTGRFHEDAPDWNPSWDPTQ